MLSNVYIFVVTNLRIAHIVKSTKTDFEQSMLSIFDDKKVRNFKEFVISDNVNCRQKYDILY